MRCRRDALNKVERRIALTDIELVQNGIIRDERQEGQQLFHKLNWNRELYPDQVFGDKAVLSYFACLTNDGLILPLQFVKSGHSRSIVRQWCWFGKDAPWEVLAWAVI